jgi:hypothetical protein
MIAATLDGVVESVTLDVADAVLTSIQIAPANGSLPVGAGSQFQATGVFSDASTQDITDLVTWSSSDINVATISNAFGSKGFAQSVAGGIADITATHSGKTATTTLTVTTATLVSISVTPVGAMVPAGYALALQAIGTFSDGTSRDLNSQVLWTSSNTSVATISNSVGTEGRVTGVVPGTATLSATSQGVTGGTVLTVTNETLDSIVVDPPSVTLAVGDTQPMMATGHFSAGFVMDVTFQVKWQVTPRSIGIVGNSSASKGLVTGRRAGNATIRASKGNKTGTASLSVTAQ